MARTYIRKSISLPPNMIGTLDTRRKNKFSQEIQHCLSSYWSACEAGMITVKHIMDRTEALYVLDAMSSCAKVACGNLNHTLDVADGFLEYAVRTYADLKGKNAPTPPLLIGRLNLLDRLSRIALEDWCRVLLLAGPKSKLWRESISSFRLEQ